jgi:dienelactone hydrolase
MLKIAFCIVSIAAQMTFAGIVPAPVTRADSATSQPAASVRSYAATDLPLKLGNPTGRLAEFLEPFNRPVAHFDYTMQLVEDDDGIQVYRLHFPSPDVSPFPENNDVPAEYYVPRNATGKTPAAIVLDIMYGNAVIPRGLARGLASQGVAALYMPMAYYNARRPKDNAHLRWIDDDPNRVVQPVRQTALDVRRAKAILAGRPKVDPERIGITGVSLGGIMTAIAAGIDGDFYRIVPILSGGDVATLVFHTRETRKERERFLEKGIDRDKLAAIMAPVEPLNFAARIDPARCLMINADQDQVIPKLNTTELWEAAGKPTLLWVPSTHYTAGWYIPTIKQTAIDFLKGKVVTRLEY